MNETSENRSSKLHYFQHTEHFSSGREILEVRLCLRTRILEITLFNGILVLGEWFSSLLKVYTVLALHRKSGPFLKALLRNGWHAFDP